MGFYMSNNVINFPEIDRVVSCIETVSNNWKTGEHGDFFLHLTLELLVDLFAMIDETDDYNFKIEIIHNHLFEALTCYRELQSDHNTRD